MKENISGTNIYNGMKASFLASLVSSLVLLLLTTSFAIQDFNYISIHGSIFGIEKAVYAWIAYFLFAIIIWGFLYTFLEPYLAGNSGTAKGMIFGFCAWLIMMIILMPLTTAGIFLKNYGFGASIIILITDMVFGAIIGHFYGKFKKSS